MTYILEMQYISCHQMAMYSQSYNFDPKATKLNILSWV